MYMPPTDFCLFDDFNEFFIVAQVVTMEGIVTDWVQFHRRVSPYRCCNEVTLRLFHYLVSLIVLEGGVQ